MSQNLIRLHLVHWDECRDWDSYDLRDLYSLCGLHVQEPVHRILSWVNPTGWINMTYNGIKLYYRCLECESHKDYPLLLLGET
jgi:hypothetical protein